MLQLILEAGREEQAECITDNLHVECAYYPDAQKLVVINNSGEKQTTKIVCEGNVWSMQLEGYETRIQTICGMENKRQ